MLENKFLEFIFINYGTYGVIAVVVIIALLKSGTLIDLIKKLVSWVKTSKVVHHSSRQVLLSRIDYWVSFKIPNIKMNDPGRQMLFRDILKMKFQHFRTYVDIADESFNEKMNGTELFHAFVASFNKVVDNYESEAIDRGIPEVVMAKYGEWQLKSYDYTVKAAELICMSSGYGSNQSRMNAIYSLITAMMELTVAEAEKTLTELNGELTGIEYKGVVCG